MPNTALRMSEVNTIIFDQDMRHRWDGEITLNDVPAGKEIR
jgi:hypothetical protein